MDEPYLNIVQACRLGDGRAQKVLFDSLAPMMLSLCLRYVPDRETARDLLQDGFVTLFSKLDSYKGEGSFEGWARRVFVTTCLMYLRKNDALRDTADLEEIRNLRADGATQIEDIGYKELMRLIGQMPAGFRTVFNMYVIEGYSHKEIAEATGVTEITSRSQLNRARAWLKNKIAQR